MGIDARQAKKIVATVALALGFWATAHFGVDYYREHGEYMIGRSPPEHNCLPWSWYLIKKSPPSPLYRGQIVMYLAKNIPLYENNSQMVKYAAAIEGDKIRILDDKIYINDAWWGDLTLIKTLKKEPGDFDTAYTLQPNEVLVLGTTDNSYDSRYWGPIQKDQIKGTAVGLY